ncbi:lipocalin family protein [uncultured Arcticibacterium sp.]|uniref:lipocalin family protein n=1 Tax=uncultured Arcticibacterium sp. TaxID=2173042 RepID=UPI0030F63C93
MKFTRTFFLLSILSLLMFGCGGDADEPTPVIDVTGKWQLDFIYTNREKVGEEPLQASINPLYGKYLTLNADGSCSLTELGLSDASFDFLTSSSFSGSYSLDGDILEIQVDNAGNTQYEIFKVKAVNAEELKLDQDKSLILTGLEKNKVWLSDEAYNDSFQFIDQYQEYDVEVEFLKE